MRYALIDLGSNTIKLSVYEVGAKGFEQIYYDVRYGYVVANIENKALSDRGIDIINKILSDYLKKTAELNAEHTVCFSTASLRFIDNRPYVIDKVYKATGIKIAPISGEQEAYYNYLSIKHASQSDSFIGADLGGGSCQVICCEKGRLSWSVSLPIGCLKLAGQFVKDTLPDSLEAKAIEEYVKQELRANIKETAKLKQLLIMGGSARTITRMLGAGKSFKKELLTFWKDKFLNDLSALEEIVLKTEPQRLFTILPGMIAIDALAEYLNSDTISLIETSVREGYLIDKVLKK